MRIFTAVLMDGEARERAAALQDELRAALGRAPITWVAPENFHFTLQFLGEQPEAAVKNVHTALTEAALQLEPFEVRLGGLGAFPQEKRPSVLWVGLESGENLLKSAHSVVEYCLQPHGFEPEGKPYHPHLTLGRVKGPISGLSELYGRLNSASLATVSVSAVSLMQSELRPEGARYTEIGHYPFGEPEA